MLSSLTLEYDPWRGGFLLTLGRAVRCGKSALAGGLMDAHLTKNGVVVAVESFWGDHGGLPLRGIHGAKSYTTGTFALSERAELRMGSVLLRQSSTHLYLWFAGTSTQLPREHWQCDEDSGTGIAAWFSSRRVEAGWPVPGVGGRAECAMLAGLRLEFERTVAAYPVESVTLCLEDFK